MKKLIKKLFIFFIVVIILLVLSIIGLYVFAYFNSKLDINSANGYYFYDNEGNSLNDSNNWVNIDEISDDLVNATISIEDKNFYKHKGFDILRILKALMINIVNKDNVQGASTISQQYVKNLFLNFDKKWSRKIDEAWLTIKLESHYKKKEILEGYLNTINYGGIYGIENASKYYFNKKASDLTLSEATILAGIPKSPSNYSPISNEKNAKKRQAIILESMVKNGYITEKEKKDAYNEKLNYYGKINDEENNTIMYYEDAVIDELKKIDSIPKNFLNTGGLKIYTSLDSNAQNLIDKKIKEYFTDNDLQTSIVLMNPNNGEILGIAGGTNYNKSQYNRVTSSKRQVGSTIKPFLYYTALENGFTSSSTFNSKKTTFTFSNNKKYSPENFGNIYPNKSISMAAAIAYSDNIFAVKTHLFLGEENLVEFAKGIGISNDLSPIPSLALGTNEINILNMMKGYAAFASEGFQIEPHFIKKVEDINGNILYEYKENKINVLNKSNVYIMNELLSNCYNLKFVDYTHPTCYSISNKLTKKYAIKTGSTDTDNWIFGYNKDVLLGTWVGYDDNTLTKSSDGVLMKNIWADIMEEYLKDKEDNWYETPNNVVGVLVDPISGKIADEKTKNATLFYYIKGTQPNYNKDDTESAINTIEE